MFTVYVDSRTSDIDLKSYDDFLKQHNIDYVVKNIPDGFTIDEADVLNEVKDIDAILSVAEFTPIDIAYSMIESEHRIFESIRKINNIAKLQVIKNSKTWFSDRLRDGYPIESTITEELVEMTDEKIWNLLEIKCCLLLEYNIPEANQIVDKIYKCVYNKIITEIDKLAEPYKQQICQKQIKKLQK